MHISTHWYKHELNLYEHKRPRVWNLVFVSLVKSPCFTF